ncbi:hypothetical protein [Actinokineospora iranica]|uniref:Uncharacterized protein n=1 Tax=Actinokineospora iranica TaxID=1271860 RepID=A0A1G6SLL6_9PSEU|nr:hypothetical protein [Actinokineospora iranica]SDD17554.1 hypothetical protein SAMN05216174_10844 [Actinokineospora iranica]
MKAQAVRDLGGRIGVPVTVSVALLVGTAESAAAATAAVESTAQFPFGGPLGIGAVVVGAGGLVLGLVRRRRVTAAAAAAEKLAEPVVVSLPLTVPTRGEGHLHYAGRGEGGLQQTRS